MSEELIDKLIGNRANVAYRYHEAKDYYAIFPENDTEEDSNNILCVYLTEDDTWKVYGGNILQSIEYNYNTLRRGYNYSESSYIRTVLDYFEDYSPAEELADVD